MKTFEDEHMEAVAILEMIDAFDPNQIDIPNLLTVQINLQVVRDKLDNLLKLHQTGETEISLNAA